MNLVLRTTEHDRERRNVSDVAKTGELLQRSLGFIRQPGELADHEVHDIVGVALGMNAPQIPGPALCAMIEGEKSFVGERIKKLQHKERVAGGLRVHQL